MRSQDIVREVMAVRGLSQQLLAEKAGFKRQTNVSECLRSNNMRVDNLLRMLNAMDCELIVKSKTKVSRPGSSETYKPEWVVTLENMEGEQE